MLYMWKNDRGVGGLSALRLPRQRHPLVVVSGLSGNTRAVSDFDMAEVDNRELSFGAIPRSASSQTAGGSFGRWEISFFFFGLIRIIHKGLWFSTALCVSGDYYVIDGTDQGTDPDG